MRWSPRARSRSTACRSPTTATSLSRSGNGPRAIRMRSIAHR
jgi:hypothetical protein